MDGINVLNFGTFLAGPLTARHLQNMGATITSIKMHEKSSEYIWNSCVVNELLRGHNVLELDLTKEHDLNIAKKLVEKTDVIIENFRPGILEKLGLGFNECKSINNRIIYLSLPGFSSTDSEYRNVKAWESVIMATSGVFKDMGLNRQLMNIPASYSQLHLASTYASIFGAFAVVCKLFMLKRSGSCGDGFIEVSLASALSEALIHNSIDFPKPYCYMNMRTMHLAKYNRHPLSYKQVNDLMDPFFAHYNCKDNRPFYLVTPSHFGHQKKVLQILGCEDLLHKISIADPYGKTTKEQFGLGGNNTGLESEVIKERFKQIFMRKTSFEWEKEFGEQEVPTSAHRTFIEWISSDHARESGLVTIDDDENVTIGPMAWLNNETETQNAHLFCDSPPSTLSGIQVLDLSNVIAGPTIGTMLARMGAYVIKIDAPTPSYAPNICVIYGLAANRGKHSILLDIKTCEGRKVLEDLIKESHIIIVNTTTSKLNALELNIDDLRKINPDILLVHFDAWSGYLESGCMKEYLGYDDNIQAGQGIMERFGGGFLKVEEHAHIGTIDVIAGVAGAFSAVCALVKQIREKKSSVGRTSLASVGQYIQFVFSCGTLDSLKKGAMISCDRLGSACRGEHLLNRCYEANDGWFICVVDLNFREDTLSLFLKLISSSDAIPHANAEMYICETLKTNTIYYWQNKLKCFVVMPLLSIQELRVKYTFQEYNPRSESIQFILNNTHPIGKLICVAPCAIRTSNININIEESPKYGCHTFEILNKFTNDERILQCVEWSSSYLPYMTTCPVCDDFIVRPFRLKCNHTICIKCARQASLRNRNRCPLCIPKNSEISTKFSSLYKHIKSGGRMQGHLKLVFLEHVLL